MGWKRQKLLKHTENSLEKFLWPKSKTKFFWDKNIFHQTWAKTLQAPETCSKTNNSAKQQQNWK